MKIHRKAHVEEVEGVEEKFTEDDLYACWAHYATYFVEVLNGEYDLNAAREDLRDLRGLIGSKWDSRK